MPALLLLSSGTGTITQVAGRHGPAAPLTVPCRGLSGGPAGTATVLLSTGVAALAAERRVGVATACCGGCACARVRKRGMCARERLLLWDVAAPLRAHAA